MLWDFLIAIRHVMTSRPPQVLDLLADPSRQSRIPDFSAPFPEPQAMAGAAGATLSRVEGEGQEEEDDMMEERLGGPGQITASNTLLVCQVLNPRRRFARHRTPF